MCAIVNSDLYTLWGIAIEEEAKVFVVLYLGKRLRTKTTATADFVGRNSGFESKEKT